MTEKTKETLEKLKEGIKNIMESEKYMEFLKTMSKFHNYSFNNMILIHIQRPDATYVAGFKDWLTKFRRLVKKGEKGITIIAPIPYIRKEKNEKGEEIETKGLTYKATHVFDISQTQGEDLPTMETEELKGKVKNFNTLKGAIEELSSIKIEYRNLENDTKGFYSEKQNLIVIKNGMSEIQTLKTLLHELAHSQAHCKLAISERKQRVTRSAMESEAESIAYVVSDYFGIDTSDYSFIYIAGWLSESTYEEFLESMKIIQKVSDDIIKTIKEKLQNA